MDMIAVRGLKYWYPEAEEPTLDGIDLVVEQGQLVAITGRSGCGKSTLLLCLKGLLPKLYGGRLEGVIQINGRDIAPLSVSELSSLVGLVMQDPDTQLCNLFVKDEVAFGVENLCVPREQCLQQVRHAMGVMALNGLADRQVHQLSGGEKQRVAIASVLAMAPPVLLLDEPTANLDSKSGREILQRIARLKELGHTLLIVQHDLDEIVNRADRLLVLDRGRVVAFDAPREVFTHFGERLTEDFGIGLPQIVSVALRTRSQFHFRRLPLTPREFSDEVKVQCTSSPSPLCLAGSTQSKEAQETIIEVRQASFTYPGADRPAVRNATFSIRKGEVVAIVGKNGSGKSTLARLIVGLLKPNSGAVHVIGQETDKKRAPLVYKSMGYVFQYPEHQFLTDTVEREIAYGLEVQRRSAEEIRTLVEEVMRLLRLEVVAGRHPFNLSGGEKRRLSVATMMVIEPTLLILDEPTYGLDEGNLINLLGFLFERLRERNITIVFITHDMRLVAEYAQRVLVMSEGEILFDGQPAVLFMSPEMMQRAELIPPPVVELVSQLRQQNLPLPQETITAQQLIHLLSQLEVEEGPRERT